jgi:hypothetical protein
MISKYASFLPVVQAEMLIMIILCDAVNMSDTPENDPGFLNDHR